TLNVIDVIPMILGEPLVAHRSIESLDVGVLLRLTRLDIFKPDTPLGSPSDDSRTQVFRAVIAAYRQRFAAPVNDLLERTDHAFRRQREVDLDAQGLTVEVINHVQNSDTASVGKLIMHEIHGPYLVHVGRYRQRLGRLPDQPLTRLDAQVQLEFAVDSIHALMVPAKAPDIAQVQKAQAKAPV